MAKVSILIPHYGMDAQKYLDLTIESIERQSFNDIEIIVSSSGEYKPKLNFESYRIKHVHSCERLHFASSIMEAYKLASKESEFVLLLNNDVILNKFCLEAMISCCGAKTGIVNPLSNSDNKRLYVAPLFFSKDTNASELIHFTKMQYNYDEMAGNFESIVNRMHLHSVMLFPVTWVAFYCTLINKKLWDELNGLDTVFRSGQEDYDFCLRAKQHGFISAIATGGFCFHFGGITATPMLTDEDRDFSINHFKTKWGNQ